MVEGTDKLATLVRHWREHNEGHRRSYLDWREKLMGAGLPETVSALERVAVLTDEMNRELERAARELEQRQLDGAGELEASTSTGEAESHSHSHDHPQAHSHHQEHPGR
jgi:hypothetical protein